MPMLTLRLPLLTLRSLVLPRHRVLDSSTWTTFSPCGIIRFSSDASSDSSFETLISRSSLLLILPSTLRAIVASEDSGYSADVEAEIDECFAYADALRDRGIDTRVVVEGVDREESETGARGLVEVRVERVTHPVMPEDIPEPAQEGAVEVTYETLGDLVQRFHDHIEAIPVHHIQVIEEVQREQGYRIVGVESAITALTELERDNKRLRGAASVEIISHRLEISSSDTLLRYRKMPNTRSGASMTNEEVKELVTRRVAEEMEAREAARTLEPLNENGDEQEGENGGNRNGGNGGNGNGGNVNRRNGENENGNTNGNHGMNYGGFCPIWWLEESALSKTLEVHKPHNFSGTKGVDSAFGLGGTYIREQLVVNLPAYFGLNWVGLMKLMTELWEDGHFRKDCPKLRSQNRGNQARNKSCTLGLLGHPFDINLMPVELGSFDVIIGMDWLAKYHALIVCDEKFVRIPYGDEVLIVRGDNFDGGSKLNIVSCTSTQKYIQKGFQVYLAQVTSKKAEDKLEEKRLEDVSIIREFPEVFPEDLPGLPPARQVEF
ncbi:putative reverse transcriptase domain-containing protein [Tanacetum coccineum]